MRLWEANQPPSFRLPISFGVCEAYLRKSVCQGCPGGPRPKNGQKVAPKSQNISNPKNCNVFSTRAFESCSMCGPSSAHVSSNDLQPGFGVSRTCPGVYILPFCAKNVPRVVSRLTLQMSKNESLFATCLSCMLFTTWILRWLLNPFIPKFVAIIVSKMPEIYAKQKFSFSVTSFSGRPAQKCQMRPKK